MASEPLGKVRERRLGWGCSDDKGSRGLTGLAGFPGAEFQGSKIKSVPGGMEGAEGWKDAVRWEASSLGKQLLGCAPARLQGTKS